MDWLISATAVEDPRTSSRWLATWWEQQKGQINFSSSCRREITDLKLKWSSGTFACNAWKLLIILEVGETLNLNSMLSFKHYPWKDCIGKVKDVQKKRNPAGLENFENHERIKLW